MQGLAALAAAATLPSPVSAAASATATVRIHDQNPAHRIRAGLFGANLQWEHNGDGAWVDGQVQPGLVDAITGAGLTSLRFPGGELANRYQWKSAVGPLAQRSPGLDYAWQPEASVFGTDELISLCRQSGTTAVITVNPNADVQDAADWVEYLNGSANSYWGAQRAANGSVEPLRTVWWEIGNESFNPYAPGFAGAADYANRYLRFRRAMRARDSSIKVGLVLESSFQTAAWMINVFPHMVSWNDDVLKIAAKDADFAVLHFYSPFDKLADDAALGRVLMAGSEAFVSNIAQVQQTLARHGRAGMPLLMSEYGVNFADSTIPSPRIATTEGALFAASLLIKMMAVADIRGAQVWSLINNSVWGALVSDGATLRRRPLYDALALIGEMATLRWLPVDVAGPVFQVGAIGNIEASEQVPALLAAAGRGEEESLKLLLVNRSDTDRIATGIATDGGGYRVAEMKVLSAGQARSPTWAVAAAPTVTRRRDAGLTVEVSPATILMIDLTRED
jgi:alpha-N-arabinofuranosidase